LAKRREKSPEELKKDDELSNSMGLYNTAEAYRLSAMVLEDAKLNIGHAKLPVFFLYYHALELFLKALLRQKHSVEAIRDNFGHKTKRLVKEAEVLGLVIRDEDRDLFSIMGGTDAVIIARYIRTGGLTKKETWPTFEDLRRTCKSVRDGVGALLRKANVRVRV
jgi:hypothetical protein